MRVNEAFPSKFIKATDLQGGRRQVTITHVEMEEMADGKLVPVAYFKGKQKGLILNRTKCAVIEDIAKTDEMDEWSGISIILYPTRVMDNRTKKMVDSIGVDPGQPQQAKPNKSETWEPPAESEAPSPDDDNIPF